MMHLFSRQSFLILSQKTILLFINSYNYPQTNEYSLYILSESIYKIPQQSHSQWLSINKYV